MKKSWILISFILLALVLMALAQPVSATTRLPQSVYQTPTPGADGRILYTVKGGDTCLSISLLTGVTIDQIRKFNNLKAECVIIPGQQLLLGLAGPAETKPASGPTATPTPMLPSATPIKGTGEVCVVLFDDVNGEGIRQEIEPILANGAVSLTDRQGKVSLTGTTKAGTEAVCFKDVPEEDYNISVAVPEGYNPTTVTNYALQLKAGDKALLNFGAQLSAKAIPAPPSEGGESSPLLGIIGGVVILAGLGLGVYVLRFRK